MTRFQRIRLRLYTLLSEPSTYAGFSSLAILLGASAEEYAVWAGAAAAFFGILAIVVRESGDA